MTVETENEIHRAMSRDQRRLRRWQARIQRSPTKEQADQWTRWRRALDQSITLRAQRQQLAARPLVLDESLPVAAFAPHIVDAIRQNPVTIISGEAGSGKSTQLPLIALQAGFGVAGMIGHTQPRRIAARSVAARLAQQLGAPLGTTVGFKIRFTDATNPATLIKVMTDGVLLAETQRDRLLEAYDCLIIDEAHERSLNIDLLTGYTKRLLVQRPELRVVITSATLDTERFAEHFAPAPGQPAPIISIPGRNFPIEVRYEPPDSSGSGDPTEAVVACCARLLSEHHPEAGGDILVFLPTEGEIHRAANKLRASLASEGRCEIMPLYARLTMAQQNAIFEPHARRRIVLATNVAESSITVPGIRYVIDAGTARISRYAARSKVQRLPIEPISQAAANQRAGRCGRVGSGICIRLYEETDFLSRPLYTTPEIRRTNLAGTILQMLALQLGDLLDFPLIDPPSPELVREGYQTLIELGAITEDRQLTASGRRMSRWPVDPRISRMILAGADEDCLADILIVASALEIPDPRVRPAEKQAAADRAHAAWDDPGSDFLTLLNLWDFIHAMKAKLSRGQQRKAWEQNFLSPSLIQQWCDVHRQLLAMVQEQGLKIKRRRDDETLHRAIVAGLLSGVACRGERNEYIGAGGIKFVLWPGSSLARVARQDGPQHAQRTTASQKREQPALPNWIVAAELVETARRYGRTVATVDPTWLEELGAHLVRRTVVDPHWSERTETAMAFENVTLFGLPIVSRRRIGYAAIDPAHTRELFVEEGLVAGRMKSSFPFLEHNRRLLDELARLVQKTRQREWLVESYHVARFYEDRLPKAACDVRALRQILRQDPTLDERLRMTPDDLNLADTWRTAAEQFPDQVAVGTLHVPVEYAFAPGDRRDGATIRIPMESLGQIDDTQLGWLIPGLLRERVIGAIRSLPKPIRRSLVPAPDIADRVVAQLRLGQGDFWQAVARELSRISGARIEAGQFDRDQIEPQWLVNVEVVDDKNNVVVTARSLREINAQLGRRPAEVAADDPRWHRDGMSNWTWGDLPRSVEVQRGAVRMAAFPAIVDQQTAVGLRLSDSPERADQLTRSGLVRLFQLAKKQDVRSHVAWLPQREAAAMKLRRWLTADEWSQGLGDLMVRVALVEGLDIPREEAAFRQRLGDAGGRLAMAAGDVARWFPQLAEAVHEVELRWERATASQAALRAALQEQAHHLLSKDFLYATPWEWLAQFPRYFAAMRVRWDKGASGPINAADTTDSFWKQYLECTMWHESQGWIDPELTLFRWMIEELRVSLFAQSLGTKIPVSPQRLQKQLDRVRK